MPSPGGPCARARQNAIPANANAIFGNLLLKLRSPFNSDLAIFAIAILSATIRWLARTATFCRSSASTIWLLVASVPFAVSQPRIGDQY